MNYIVSIASTAIATHLAFKVYSSLSVLPSQTYIGHTYIPHVDEYSFTTPQGSDIHYRIKDLTAHRPPSQDGTQEKKVLFVFHPNKSYIHDFYYTLLNFDHFAKNTEYTHLVFWDYPNTGFSKSKQWLVDKPLLVEDGLSLVREVTDYLVDGDYSKVSFYGWSLGGGVASEVAYELQKRYGDEAVISSITLDRTFSSVADHIHKNTFIPLPTFLAEFREWLTDTKNNVDDQKYQYERHKLYIPISKPIADMIAWWLDIDFRTEEAFNALKTAKKKVYYIDYDEKVGDSIFKHSHTGEFIEAELVNHSDPMHLLSNQGIDF